MSEPGAEHPLQSGPVLLRNRLEQSSHTMETTGAMTKRIDRLVAGGLALPAGLLLLIVSRRMPSGQWWWKSLVLGVLNVGAFFVLLYVAAQLLPSSVASTIMATSAAAMMLLAWPLLRERPRLLPALGAAIGIAGVAVMLAGGAGDIDLGGVAASITAMAMSSLGFLLTKKWVTTESTIAVTSWQLVAGGLLLVPVALAAEGPAPALDASTLAGFAYVSVIATALAYVAWFSGLRHLPAASVGLIGLLNPVAGVLLGVLVATEPFGLRQLVGTILVFVGVLVGQRLLPLPRGSARHWEPARRIG